MRKLRLGVTLSVLTACAPPLRSQEPPPPATEVAFDIEVTPPPVAAGTGSTTTATRDQPPEIKLRLGHYSNASRGIGVTIDRTSELSPNAFKVAKLRYDGTDRILVLDPLPGPARRIDYYDRRTLVLQVHDGGRAAIWIDGDGPIALHRDGDADPL